MLQCRFGTLWMSLAAASSIQTAFPSHPVLLRHQTDVIHHNVASRSYGRRRFVLIIHIPSVGRYDPVHSTWSVIPVYLLFTSIPVGLLFQYICYSSADVTQSIPVYLIFVSWYDPVFDPVHSSLFVIS